MVRVALDPRATCAGHPDAIVLDAGVQLAAVLVLEDEGFKGVAEGGSQRESRLAWPRCPRA